MSINDMPEILPCDAELKDLANQNGDPDDDNE